MVDTLTPFIVGTQEIFVCNKCGIEKDRSAFTRHKGRAHGIVLTCKKCESEVRNTKENKIKLALRARQSREKNTSAWMHYRTKSRCKRLGIPYTLEITDIVIPEVCPVLGIPLQVNFTCIGDNSPSLDRINPKLGYVKNNIQVISTRANKIKSNASALELDAVVRYLEKNLVALTSNTTGPENRLQ